MHTNSLDPRRLILCGRINAERVAIRMSEQTEEDHAVVRTRSRLQPLRVIPAVAGDLSDVELQVFVR